MMGNEDDSIKYDDDDFEDYSSDSFEEYNEPSVSNTYNCSQKEVSQDSIHVDQSHTTHYQTCPHSNYQEEDGTCSLKTFTSSEFDESGSSLYDQYRSKLSTPYFSTLNDTSNTEDTFYERACQYNDDHQDIATITDDVRHTHRSLQCTNGVDDTLFYYTINACQRKDMIALKNIATSFSEKPNIFSNYIAQSSSASSLEHFLNRVTSTMEILLYDNIEFEKSKNNRDYIKNERIVCNDEFLKNQKREFDNDNISRTHCELRHVFQGKKIVEVVDSKIHNSSFLSMHVPNCMYSSSNDDAVFLNNGLLASKSVIAFWSKVPTSEPIIILIGEGMFRCVCQFDRKKSGSIVICGTNEGLLYLWNIVDTIYMDTKSIALHATITSWIKNLKADFYRPCFEIDCVEDSKKNYFSPVISLVPVPKDGVSDQTCSSQLVSLDEAGKIIFWILHCNNLPTRKTPYLSQLRVIDTVGETPIGLYFSPHWSNKYFVPLSNGDIRVRAIYGELQVSKRYVMSNVKKERILSIPKVITIQFSPFHQKIFLVGCNENHIFLFHESFPLPLLTLDPYSYLCEKSLKMAFTYNQIDIRWSSHNACVFFLLQDSFIYVYDLSVDDLKPIMDVDLTTQDVNLDFCEQKYFIIKNDKVGYNFATFNDTSCEFRCKKLSQMLGFKETTPIDDNSLLLNAYVERKTS